MTTGVFTIISLCGATTERLECTETLWISWSVRKGIQPVKAFEGQLASLHEYEKWPFKQTHFWPGLPNQTSVEQVLQAR